jgi:glycosyltransferase involved in cell wall biosynthesis/peptidoglycan/xylan/chitin deacetylase (PgdA/CDA1 family)/SAM-dependent methyltransferase
MSVPSVSVIVPARNAAATLATALASLQSQTEAGWEAIVVDDGSSDGTAATARDWAARDRRIRVLRQEQGGAAHARNAGIAAANGEWLLFLDADDWIAPTHLERLLGALAGEPAADVAVCGYRRALAGGCLSESCLPDGLAGQPFEIFARRNAAAIHCFLVRRRLLATLGGFDPTLATCEDWDLWQRVARSGAQFTVHSEGLAYYRTAEGSLSTDRLRLARDALTVLARGRAPDPRVPSPEPRFAAGCEPASSREAGAYFVCWCAAAEAALGRRPEPLLDLLDTVPDLKDTVHFVRDTVIAGLVAGSRRSLPDLASLWPAPAAPFAVLFARLAAASTRPGLALRLTRAVEIAILRAAAWREPVVLATTMAQTIELAAIAPVEPPAGIDSLLLRLCAGPEVLAELYLPVWGRLSPRAIAELALERLGFDTLYRRGAFARRPGYWAALAQCAAAAALRSGAALPRRDRARRIRQALAGLRRRALLASVGSEAMPPAPPMPLDGDAAAASPSPEPGRAEVDPEPYWERVFRAEDPWDYGSAYEQLKYRRTLALLPPNEPIGSALELACAEGRFTRMLAARVGRLLATDIAERALARAQARCADLSNVCFRQLDLAHDPLPEGLDLIVCSEVLYYLGDRAALGAALARLRDSLAPGGRLLMAHAFVLGDDPRRTGFDWSCAFGARAIADALAGAEGLHIERAVETELYRIDLWRKDVASAAANAVATLPLESELAPEVARQVVWGGALARRAELAASEAATRVPVLTYHRVAEHCPPALRRYCVGPDAFEAQLRFLRRHGYRAVTSLELDAHLGSGRPLPGRPVLITFDDGYRDFHDLAWPILRRNDFTAEVFLPTDRVGSNAAWDAEHGAAPLMSWEEIATLAREGVHFSSHLASHEAADGLSSQALLDEAVRSRRTLAERVGQAPVALAYPFGVCDERIARLAALAGYRLGFTTRPGLAALNDARMTLPRIEVRGDHDLGDFARSLAHITTEDATAMQQRPDLVSVVVPAYNASRTIDETLRSIRAQSHANLEILVVDDGSTDATPEIVLRHAALDARIRLIRQPNGGVAAARNRGIAEARGELVALIDADDLWRPDKIARQLQAMAQGGQRIGLVYCWYALIDELSRIISLRHRPTEAGNVLARMCIGNLVGNGSSAMIRRQALLEVGSYDPSLRARGAQGCEDHKLHLQIAERYEFAVVPEHLTGYRRTPTNMSSDVMQMLRSYDLVVSEFRPRLPQFAAEFHAGRNYILRWLLTSAVRLRRHREAAVLARTLLAHDRRYGLATLLLLPAMVARSAVPGGTGRPFAEQLPPPRPESGEHFLGDGVASA